jgi:cell division protein FtsQ
VIGGGMLTLLVAAIGKKNRERCSDYIITVKSDHNNFFIDGKDIFKLLKSATNGNIKGQPMSSMNLRRLEELLEDNVWIKNAELYFDNQDILHVAVTEREPLARIFTTAGNSFYIDSSMKRIPLSDKMSARVPVFSDFPDKKNLSVKDNLLLNEIKATAQFIMNDPFWMSQVEQIDITPERNFEMIPVVGNHIVKLGDGENIEKKFHRLFVFYKDILSKTGFDKYKTIDVQYEGEVVAVKGKTMTKIDSAQLRKNVEKLLQEAQQMHSDTIFTTNSNVEKQLVQIDSTVNIKKDFLDSNNKKTTNPNPLKSTLRTKSNEKQKSKPKAVMPERETN